MNRFSLQSDFRPCGDQPQAIDTICNRLSLGERDTILLGITGSGKTFTMANIIQNQQRPALIMAPNKTLAAQLYSEFKELFPYNAVEYFVSYYDYYQPEAYLPVTDTYIEKDASINELIDKMRHSTTASALSRPDVIVIASVSCIYGLGSPETYKAMHLLVQKGQVGDREKIIRQLIRMRYDRNDIDFHRGTFRVRGEVIEIFPSAESEQSVRLEFEGDEIKTISTVDPLTGTSHKELDMVQIFPNSHYLTNTEDIRSAVEAIQEELRHRLDELKKLGKNLEAERLEKRTYYDIEMIEEIGYCQGIENYSRYFDGRKPGETPYTLFDYLGSEFMLFTDESHISIPQIGGMYRGDRSRKLTLVEHGFRLPSALDNRPLTFSEFEKKINQVIYVSATPGPFELKERRAHVVKQIIRPTGLLDPEIIVKPAKGQVHDLTVLCRERIKQNERVLVTTMTKRMAEDLTEFLSHEGIQTRYLHSDIDTLERVEILRGLRKKDFDVLVGINLLREGLDLPEVSLVAILDADREGFLRSERSLIQTFGRTSRNINGLVVMYADKITKSMKKAMDETALRRRVQIEHNRRHNITPKTIIKNISESLTPSDMDYPNVTEMENFRTERYKKIKNIPLQIDRLRAKMFKAAQRLDFEKATELRDEIEALQKFELLKAK